jgi:catechol 2,3-dioxygenase-like lactoylglutathione lyase family enzyme
MHPVQLFHYHLVTNKAREVEARYIGKLGFELVARHGRIGGEVAAVPPGIAWQELDELGFALDLSELSLGAVIVVVQPGRWELPRVDHLGLALDEDELEESLGRAQTAGLPIEDADGPSFVSTNAGYRLELHPQGGAIDALLAQGDQLRLLELHLKTDDPEAKAAMLADVLDCVRLGGDVEVGETLVRFLPGGPRGRPELYAERFT